MKTPTRHQHENSNNMNGGNHNVVIDDTDDEDDRKPPPREIRFVRMDNNSHNNHNNIMQESSMNHNNIVSSDESSSSAQSSSAVAARAVQQNSNNSINNTNSDRPVVASSSPSGTMPYATTTITAEKAAAATSASVDTPMKQPPPSFAAITTPAASYPPSLKKWKVLEEDETTAESTHVHTNNDDINTSLLTLQNHVIAWGITTVVAISVFIYQILPSAAFATLMFLMASSGMLSQSLYNVIQQWYYNNIQNGNGIGQYILPASIYELLTQTSLHDYMTDDTFVREYRHLLLYFMPLSEEQLQQALSRIAPQHRERLFRPGLGHFVFGNTIMQWLIGNQQLQQQPNVVEVPAIDVSSGDDQNNDNNNNGNAIVEIPSSVEQRRQRRLDLDDDDSASSDLGLDINANDLYGGLSDTQAAIVARQINLSTTTSTAVTPLSNNVVRTVTTNTTTANNNNNNNNDGNNNNDNNTEDYADQEMQVLRDAFWDATYGSVWYPVRDYVTNTVVSSPIVRRTVSWGTIITTSSFLGLGGLGLWTYWSGIAVLPSSFSTMIFGSATSRNVNNQSFYQQQRNNNNNYIFWTGTAITAIGGLGLSWYASRQFRQQQQQNNDNNKQPPTEELNKKKNN